MHTGIGWVQSVVLGLLALGSSTAAAQRPAPERVLIDSEKRFMRAWVVQKGYTLRADPDESAALARLERPLRFMEMCFVAALHPDPATDPKAVPQWLYLVHAEDGKVTRLLGWARARDLLRHVEALKEGGTHLYRQAMIVNSVKTLIATGGKYAPEAPIYLQPAPSDDPEKRGQPILLNDLFFVYLDTHPDNDHKGFALVGRKPQFREADPQDDEDQTKRTIVGWIEKHRLCIWNTREGLEFEVQTTLPKADPRRKKPAEVFYDLEQAYSIWRPKPAKPLMTESWNDGVSVAMTDSQPRFPLLKPVPDRRSPHLGSEYQPPGKPRNTVRRIGAYAGAYTRDGKYIPPETLREWKEKIEILKAQVTRTEILFVLDDTTSMGPWQRAVVAACEEIIALLAKDSTRHLKVAVTFYSDIIEPETDARKAVDADRLRDFRKEGDLILRRLRLHAEKPDKERGGGDPPEQLFWGLQLGLARAGFSPHARKLVVVIGDSGNNPKYDLKNPARPTEATIAAALTPIKDTPAGRPPLLETPVEVYGIQVIDPDRWAADPLLAEADKRAAVAFRAEIRGILTQSRTRLASDSTYKDFHAGEYIMLEDVKTLQRRILERFAELQKLVDKMSAFLASAGEGRVNLQPGPEMEMLFSESGIDLNLLRNLQGAQVFEYGYVWEKDPDGIPQVRKKILASAADLEDLIRLIDGFLGRRVNIESLITRAIESQAGEGGKLTREELKKKPIDIVVAKIFGFQMQSPLLKRRLEEANLFAVYDQDLQDLNLKKMRLEDILKRRERHYDWKEVILGGNKVRQWFAEGEAKPRDRHFLLAGDETVQWYWLDYEKEWP